MPRILPLVFAFEAVLATDSPFLPKPTGRVSRTIAMRDDQTLEHLHEALRLAFGWADPHLHAFWIGTKFWDRDAVRYSAPFELEDGELSSKTKLIDVGLVNGSKLAYLFDYGDEWRLLLTVVDTWPAADHSYPMLVDAEGIPPPQYLDLDED